MSKSSKAMSVVVALLGLVIAWFFGNLMVKDGFGFVRVGGVLFGIGLAAMSLLRAFRSDTEEEEFAEEEDF